MQRLRRLTDRNHPVEHLRLRQGASSAADVLDGDVFERLSFDVVHDQIEACSLLEMRVCPDEIGVSSVEQDLGFDAKLALGGGVSIEGFLYGACMAHVQIARTIDMREAATANVGFDAITATQYGARRQGGRLLG